MRTIRITGPQGSNSVAVNIISTVAGDAQTTKVSDLSLLNRVLRLPGSWEPVGLCNWFTSDGYCMVTSDGYLFNVKD